MPIIEGSRQRQPRYSVAGAPPANHGAGEVRVGDLYVNASNGTIYVCTATNGTTTATWAVVGAQT